MESCMRGKVFAFAALLLASPPSSLAQGLVYFGNASSIGWSNPAVDRYVRWGNLGVDGFGGFGIPRDGLVSSNYNGFNFSSLRAALYYAASTDFDPNFVGYVQAAGGLATFKASTSATAGSWFGGNRTLDTIGPGTTANLVVLVWDSSLSTDPQSAAAKSGLWGASSVFQYTPPTIAQPQRSDLLMYGLTFPIVPEPGALPLLLFGAFAVRLLRTLPD